jgi:cell division protein FtsW (lipid II flippase)
MMPSVDKRSGMLSKVDWVLVMAIVPILGAGLITIHSFGAESTLLYRQLIWLGIALTVFFTAAAGNYQFLRRRGVVVSLFIATTLALLPVIFLAGSILDRFACNLRRRPS